MAKRGRPVLGVRRDVLLNIRTTREHIEEIGRWAAAEGLSGSEYIRRAVDIRIAQSKERAAAMEFFDYVANQGDGRLLGDAMAVSTPPCITGVQSCGNREAKLRL